MRGPSSLPVRQPIPAARHLSLLHTRQLAPRDHMPGPGRWGGLADGGVAPWLSAPRFPRAGSLVRAARRREAPRMEPAIPPQWPRPQGRLWCQFCQPGCAGSQTWHGRGQEEV